MKVVNTATEKYENHQEEINKVQTAIGVENGALTSEDLRFLLEGEGEEGLDEMVALKQAGLAAVHIDK